MAGFLVSKTAATGSTNGGTSVTTAAIDTTGANLLVALVCSASNNATLTDSKSNTWTGLTGQSTGNGAIRIYYCYGGTVGSGHTFTATTGAPSIVVYAFANAAASPFDQQNGTQTSVAGTTIAPGSITPTQNEEILVAGAAAGVVPETVNLSGFYQDEIALLGGQHYSLSTFFKMQQTAAAFNPTFTFNASSGTSAAASASFKTTISSGSGGEHSAVF